MYVFDLPNRKATPMFPLKAGDTLLPASEVENPVSTISTSTADAVLDNTAPVGLWNLATAAGLVGKH